MKLATSISILLIATIAMVGCSRNTPKGDTMIINQSIQLSDGTQMDYRQRKGNGQQVLLIHGLASNSKAWDKVIPHLTSDQNLLLVDLPRYLDLAEAPKVSLQKYASYCHELLEQLDIESAVVVGHSMGGQIALHLAKNHPSSVQRLVLLAPAGLETFDEKDQQWFKSFITPEFYQQLPESTIKRNFDVNFYGGQLPEDATFMYQERLDIMKDSTVYARYNRNVVESIHAMLDEPVAAWLSQISTPTTIIFGKSDQLIPNRLLHSNLTLSDVTAVGKAIPNHRIEMIDQAGHFVQWDQPAAVAQYINQ